MYERGNKAESGRAPSVLDKLIGSLTPMQALVLEQVEKNPGVTIRGVADGVDCSHTTASHHLSVLQRKGLIVREKQGRNIQHFLVRANTDENRLQHLVDDEKKRRILQHLVSNPGVQWTVNELACEIGVYHGLLLRTLKTLSDQECVRLLRPRSRYYVQTGHKLCTLAPALGLDLDVDNLRRAEERGSFRLGGAGAYAWPGHHV